MSDQRRPSARPVIYGTDPVVCQVCAAPVSTILIFPSSNVTVVVAICNDCKKALKGQL